MGCVVVGNPSLHCPTSIMYHGVGLSLDEPINLFLMQVSAARWCNQVCGAYYPVGFGYALERCCRIGSCLVRVVRFSFDFNSFSCV